MRLSVEDYRFTCYNMNSNVGYRLHLHFDGMQGVPLSLATHKDKRQWQYVVKATASLMQNKIPMRSWKNGLDTITSDFSRLIDGGAGHEFA